MGGDWTPLALYVSNASFTTSERTSSNPRFKTIEAYGRGLRAQIGHSGKIDLRVRELAMPHWIHNPDRFTAGRCPTNHSVSQPGRIGAKRVDEFLLHMIGGTQEKLF